MNKFEGVANTLFVPLVARIAISKEFPQYFLDKKALELEKYLPEGATKGASQYSNMASASRYYNMDKMLSEFALKHNQSNVVFLGAGLETAYDRLNGNLSGVHWFQLDIPEVIEVRKKVFGERESETLIASDMFKMDWVKQINTDLPTLLLVSGVFQYFHEEEIVSFIKNCKKAFSSAEIIFDATSKIGLLYTNRFIKKTGNKSALMYFGVDDSKEFARKCDAVLLEEKTFFTDALKMLGRKLSLITRISMKTAEKKKMALILHMAL